MSKTNIYVFNIIMAASLGMLTACTSVAPVKEVTADQAGYLSKKFSPQLLSPSIAKKLPAETKANNFGRLVITTETTSEQADGKKESWKTIMTLVDGGNGYIQRMVEASNNDIPYLLLYSLSYKNFVDLKWQQVPLRGSVTSMIYEVKDISRFDPVPSSVGKDFVIESSVGTDAQIANFLSNQRTCKTSRLIAAKEIHEKLSGQGIEFECQFSRNNALQYRTKWVMLEAYGAAIPIEEVTSAKKTITRVVDVNS